MTDTPPLEFFEDTFVDRFKELTTFVIKSLDYFAGVESAEDISQRRELDKSEERAKRKILALMETMAEVGQDSIRESISEPVNP